MSKYKVDIEVFQKRIFQLLIFLLPSQLAYHFWPDWAFIFGIRTDYLSPTVYLTDILILLLFVAGFLDKVLHKERIINVHKDIYLKLLIFLVFVLLNIFSSQSSYPAAFKWLKLFELGYFAYYVSVSRLINFKEWLLKPLGYSLIFFSAVGISQFILGHTLGGVFYFFGERSFNLSTPGIALVEILGKDFLRAYSTFPHPNSLAGYFFVAMVLTLGLDAKRITNSKQKLLIFVFSFLAIVLSFSASAILSVIFVFALYILLRRLHLNFSKWAKFFVFLLAVFSVALPLFSKGLLLVKSNYSDNIFYRLALAEASGRILVKSPIFGVGLNNFIVSLPKYILYPQVSWWLQPVHNIFLLIFTETGIVGLFMLLIFFNKIFRKLENSIKDHSKMLILIFIFIALSGTVDHYWFTLQQNLLLLSLVTGLTFNKFWCKVKS